MISHPLDFLALMDSASSSSGRNFFSSREKNGVEGNAVQASWGHGAAGVNLLTLI